MGNRKQPWSACLARYLPVMILLAGVLALAVYMLALNPGGHDISTHLFRVTDVATLLSQGTFAADLSPAAANGKGLPVYVYYSQWVYWLPAILVLLGIPVFVSLKLSYLVFTGIALAGSYRLARLHVSPTVAAMGTGLLASSVYFIGDIFTRSAYAEFAACAGLPWVLWAITVRTGRGSLLWCVLPILLMAPMILFHPASFLNTIPAMMAYALYLQAGGHRVWLRLLVAIATALLLTLFFWLPAMMEMHAVRGTSVFPEKYSETWVPLLHQLGSFELPLNAGPLLAWTVIILSLRALWRRWRGNGLPRRTDWLLAGVMMYVFLMSPPSEFVWELFTPLQANAFTWRLMMPMVMLASLYVAIAFAGLSAIRWQTLWASVLLLLAISQGALYLWVKGDRPVWQETPPAIVAHRIQQHAAQEWGWGVYEYLPMPGVAPQPPADRCVTDLPMMAMQGEQHDWQVQPVANEAGCLLRLPLYWHLRYTAWQGDNALPLYASADGHAMVEAGPSSDAIHLRWTRPPYVWVADVISIMVGLLLAIAYIRKSVIRSRCCNGKQ